MKHYKISEFAAMVGLPQSRLRFYEKYGLFEVKRSKNGYRYYTPEDAFRVNAFRMLLQYGFTVERAIQMLDEKQSGEVFLNSLMTQKACLTQEIERLKHRLLNLNYAIDLIKSEPCSDFQVIDSEDYLYIQASYGREFSISQKNSDLIAQFVELLSVTHYARIISVTDFKCSGDSVNPSYIMVIPLSEAYLLPDCHDKRIRRLSLGKCLFFHRFATRAQSILKSSYEEAFEYIESHGYQIRADLVILPSFLNLDGNGQDIETVLIPIK